MFLFFPKMNNEYLYLYPFRTQELLYLVTSLIYTWLLSVWFFFPMFKFNNDQLLLEISLSFYYFDVLICTMSVFFFFFYRSITRAYYRNSVGGLLLFDITNRRSFQNVHEWLEEARSHVQPHNIVFLLVGHKCDLEPQRQVSQQEAEKLAVAYGMRYVETSARDAINVERAFTELTRDIFELVKRGDITIQEGWEGVKSGFVPNVVHSSEEVTKSDRRCLC